MKHCLAPLFVSAVAAAAPAQRIPVQYGGLGSASVQVSSAGDLKLRWSDLPYKPVGLNAYADFGPLGDPASPHSDPKLPGYLIGGSLRLRNVGKYEVAAQLRGESVRLTPREELGSDFDFVGNGYGFLGLRDATSGLPTARQAGEKIFEDKLSSIVIADRSLQVRRGHVLIHSSVGWKQEGLRGQNPAADLAQFSVGDPRFDPNGDSPIDFSPSSLRKTLAGSIGVDWRTIGGPSWSFDLSHQRHSSRLSLGPGSQLALNALAALDARLVGPGSFLWDDAFQTVPTLDALGNQVYALDAGAGVPTITRQGSTTEAVLRVTKAGVRVGKATLTASAGLWSGSAFGTARAFPVGEIALYGPAADGLSPWLSLRRSAWLPAAADSFTLGQSPVPATSYTASAGVRSRSLQALAYIGWIQNPFELVPLIPGSRLPLTRLKQYDRASDRGVNVSWRGEAGPWTLSADWTHSVMRPLGNDETGLPAPPQFEEAPLNRLSLSLQRALPWGEAELRLNHRSSTYATDILRDGHPVPFTTLDLELRSRNWALGVNNLLDERKLMSFYGVGGAAFQRGRTLWVRYTVR